MADIRYIDNVNENMAEIYAFGTSLLPYKWSSRRVKKLAELACDIAKETEGFLGVHPVIPRGSLFLFRTENNAKIARNRFEAAGIRCGNIGPCYIDKAYAKET